MTVRTERAAWAPLLALFFLAAARPSLAHGGEAPGPWWTLWNGDPLVLGSLALAAALYGRGRAVARLRGKDARPAIAFAAAILVLLLALISPIDGLSDALSAAHMVQHMLLMMVAAPLWVLGNPVVTFAAALPRDLRRHIGRAGWRLRQRRPRRYWLFQPLAMWATFAAALWVWHLPGLYEAALRSEAVHHGQHLSFFITSCLFWRVLLDPLSRLRLDRGLGVLYLFATSLHATLLGVFMALAPQPWYPSYMTRTGLWRLSPLEDQQVAGLLMWMPGCMVYALAAAALGALWLREPGRPRGRPHERA